MAEVLLGQRIRDPLSIDHLALGKRNVHRVGDPVVEVIRFKRGRFDHKSGPSKALTYL